MSKSRSQLIGKVSLLSSIGLLIGFIAISAVTQTPDQRDRLLIFDNSSNYIDDAVLSFPNIGIVEFSYPSIDPRFNLSKFPVYIILSHDRKEVKFITDKKEKINEFYKELE